MKLSRQSELSSLSTAIIIVANSLCWPFSSINGVLVFFVLLALFLYLLGGNKIFCKQTLPLLMFVAVFFLCSFMETSGNTTLRTYCLSFISLGFVGITCSCGRFDIRKVILYICLFSVLLIPHIANMDFSNLDYGVWMGISYGTLKYIIALVFAIFFLDWKSKGLRLLLVLPLLFYIKLYAQYASRGAVLSFLIFIYFAILIKFNISRSKALILLASTVLVFFIFILPIISFGVHLLNDAGLHFYAFDKMLRFGLTDNIYNGREHLARNGMKLFFNSPILGNGIAYFEQYYDTIYVHNFIVQLLLEGGVIFGVPLILISFYPILFLFDKRITEDKRLFLAFLFTSSIVGLLFSDTLWRNQCYWFYLGYSLRIFYRTRTMSNKLYQKNTK